MYQSHNRLRGVDTSLNKVKTQWSAYALICLAHISMHTFTEMHIALIPVFRDEFSLDTVTIGLFASIPLLIQAIFTIPGGLLADRFDRVKMIAFSLGLSAVGGVLIAFTNSVPLIILYTSCFLISATLLHPPALSAVGDLVSSRVRGKALGVFNSAGAFGISLGPIALSILLGVWGWRPVYLLWSIPAFLIPWLLFRLRLPRSELRSRSPEDSSSNFQILRNASLVILLAILGARAVAGNVLNTYITPYFVDVWSIDHATASLIFGIRPLMAFFASPLGGAMVDRISEKIWMAIGLIAQIISICVIAFSPSLTWIIIGYLLNSFFGTMEMPAVQSLIARLTPQQGRGFAFSLSFLPGTLTGAVAPIAAAFLVAAWGLWYIFPLALVMLVCGLGLLSGFWRRIP